MISKLLLLPALLFFTLKIFAQTDTISNTRPNSDSLLAQDTALLTNPLLVNDTAMRIIPARRQVEEPVKHTAPTLSWQQDTAYKKLYKNLYPAGKKSVIYMLNSPRQASSKDEVFYMIAGLFLLVAIVRSSFPKYFQNMLRLFFQSSYRQKQSRESLLQDNFPSLLLNVTFLLSGGLLIALLAAGAPQAAQLSLWQLWLYTVASLAVIYIGKYLFISFCGWAFNVPQFAFNYNFIVFLINKVTGIFLLPLLLLLAFASGQAYDTVVTVTLSVVLIMLLYRYIVALGTVVKNLKINAVHFFIYLCAVEILPLLVIYKLLFIVIK